MKHQKLALVMLVTGLLLSYSWQWVPVQYSGEAFSIVTSLHVIVVLYIIGMTFTSPEVLAVVALLIMFKLTVITCNAWYIVDPWEVRPGEALCSARLNMPLGFIGLGLGVLLAARIARGRKK